MSLFPIISVLQNYSPVQSVVANFRIASFNIYNFDGTIDAKYNAIRDHINRVDADIVFLTEVSSAGYTTVQNNLASDCGYSYTARGTEAIAGNCFMSKTPLSNVQSLTNAYINAPGGGAEMPINTGIARCEITVSNQTVTIYGVHFEPWCMTGPCANEERETLEFPRAIQIKRVFDDYTSYKASNPANKFIFCGDFNDDDQSPQTSSFASEPAGIRGTFTLGSDITFPYTYATYPDQFLTGFTVLKGTDLNGDRNTIWVGDPNSAFVVAVRLDYIAIGSGITLIGDEVLNSEVDSNDSGLPKVGSPLTTGSSQDASDHKLIFADLRI